MCLRAALEHEWGRNRKSLRGKRERKKEEGEKEEKERKKESKGRGKEVKTERELSSVNIHAFISCTNPY